MILCFVRMHYQTSPSDERSFGITTAVLPQRPNQTVVKNRSTPISDNGFQRERKDNSKCVRGDWPPVMCRSVTSSTSCQVHVNMDRIAKDGGIARHKRSVFGVGQLQSLCKKIPLVHQADTDGLHAVLQVHIFLPGTRGSANMRLAKLWLPPAQMLCLDLNRART